MNTIEKIHKKRKNNLLVILALLVTGFAFGKSLLGNVGRLDGEEETLSQAEEEEILNETDPVDPEATEDVAEEEEEKKQEEEREEAELIESNDNIVNKSDNCT